MKENDEIIKLDEPLMNEIKVKKCHFIPLICICILVMIIILGIILFILLTKEEYKPNEDNNYDNNNNDKSHDNTNKWEDSYKKANEFISKLNLTEKVNLLFGTQNMKWLNPKRTGRADFDHHCIGEIDAFQNDKVNFKGICMQDGSSGVRFANGTGISWQANLNLASTFNKKLMYEVGKTQGEEDKEKGINILLAPSVSIMRTPQAGRVWEAYGDDPFFSGVCASEYIKGIQDTGVIATIKHFVGNEQETYRHSSSSNIDMSTLMDIYVEPFYRAIHDANVGSIMTGYNAVNNSYCNENKLLLTDILRGILEFKGFIMSDWWGIYSNHSDTFNSGLDMNMPGGTSTGNNSGRKKSYWSNLEKYVDEKIITEERITESATRIIATMYQMNQMEEYPNIHIYNNTINEERKILQRKVATESQILLKNDDNILPLKNIKSIAVIGNDAIERDCPIDEEFFTCKNNTNEVINGHLPSGYGSSTTDFNYLITPLQGIKEFAEKNNIKVESSGKLIYTDEERNNLTVHIKAKEDIENGVEIAKECDVAIVFVMANSGEGIEIVENSIGDREDLDLWHGGNELVEAIAEVNQNIIVVINAPAVVNLPWLNKVKAVVFSGFPGAESGHAIADILFGIVNPSGHLPYVWGKIDDYCTKIENLDNMTVLENGKTYKDEYRYDGIDSAGLIDERPGYDKEQYNYTEGLYVGQRWFNKQNIKPIFPFGFGLTYTTFEYSDLKTNITKDGLIAEFNVKNIGLVSGSAVPMLFLTFPDNIGDYPKYIFKGFEKVELEAGENKKVNITVDDHALSYFNVQKNKYDRVNNGIIKVYIAENGDPNEEPRLKTEIDCKF